MTHFTTVVLLALVVGFCLSDYGAAAATLYSYDTLNRLTRVAYPDGTTITYTYDAAGNRLSQIISNPSIPLPSLGIDKNTLTFSAAVGRTAPTQIVVVTNGGGGSLQWNAISTASWLTVTPATGTNNSALTIAASAASLSTGNYSASIQIFASAANAPTTIPVSLTVTAAALTPTFTTSGILSAAGFQPGLTRGSIASIFGTSLADGPAQASSAPLPVTLGSVQVTVNGVNAPLWYVGPGQINFQVPFEAPLQGLVSILVIRDGTNSSPGSVTLAPYAPSIFTYQRTPGVLDPIIAHAATGLLVTPTSPAVPGEYVTAYGTGIGDLSTLPATGNVSPKNPPATAKVIPTATIGSVNAPVTFAGLTPYAVGLAQFNIQVPNNLSSGSSLPLTLQFGNATSPPVNLWVTSPAQTTQYTITTVAGNGNYGYSGEGVATAVSLNLPFGVAVDSHGAIYIADWGNNRVRKVTVDGTISIVAGTGTQGFSGDGGPATNAQLYQPDSVTVDATDNLYIAELGHKIRRVSTDGTIGTIAGTGVAGYSGDGGPASQAQINYPSGVTVDAAGNLYIAETGNNVIRKVTPDGNIQTVKSGLNKPQSVAVDGSGNVYVAQFDGGIIRLATDGTLTSVGHSIAARGVAIEPAGTLLYTEYYAGQVWRVAKDGTTVLLAGTGVPGFSGDGGPAAQAQLNGAREMAIDSSGNIFVTDYSNIRIRRLSSVALSPGLSPR